jgi:hypothetical protein
MWDVAQALGKALDAAGAARKADAARDGAAEVLGGLSAAIAELRKAAAPAAALPEGECERMDSSYMLSSPALAKRMHARLAVATHVKIWTVTRGSYKSR